MKEAIEEKVKTLIIEANAELEAHNFDKSKEICNQALELDSDDPNIYLILLLAEYKVTEIEDLKNCKFDYESETYKNVRRCADKELNDELDKYLIDKDIENENENDKVNEENNNYFTQLKNKFIGIIWNLIEFCIGIEQTIEEKKKNKTNPIVLLLKIPKIIDFYSDKKKYSGENVTQPEVAQFLANNRSKNKQNKNIYIYNEISASDTVASLSTFILMLPLFFQIMFLFITPMSLLDDKKYFAFLCSSVIDTLFVLILKKNYKRIILWEIIEEPNIFITIFKSIINLVLSIVLLLTNFYVYACALRFLENNKYFLGLSLGILGSLIINYLYIQIYSFFRNVSIAFTAFKNYLSKR